MKQLEFFNKAEDVKTILRHIFDTLESRYSWGSRANSVYAEESLKVLLDDMEKGELCSECGRSVAGGSGNFVNRVPDLNTPKERARIGRPFPLGNYICSICMEKGFGK